MMESINERKVEYKELLEHVCKQSNIDQHFINTLLEAEKVKRLLKRKAFMQQTIAKELNDVVK